MASIAAAAIVSCVQLSAAHYQLPEHLIWTILKAEGGHVGQQVRNANGSYDLGPMQINDRTWLPVLGAAYGEPARRIRAALLNDACYNIRIGSWILRQSLDEAGEKNFWEGVGFYNSHSPAFKLRYRSLVIRTAKTLYGSQVFGGSVPGLPHDLDSIPVMSDARPPAGGARMSVIDPNSPVE